MFELSYYKRWSNMDALALSKYYEINLDNICDSQQQYFVSRDLKCWIFINKAGSFGVFQINKKLK